MLSRCIQDTAHVHQPRPIELQCFHRCSPDRREANDLSAIHAPPQVFTPALLAWMKQWGHKTSERVKDHGARRFMTVTALAGQGEIVGLSQTTCLAWDNMVNG